jgi:hypothetical protein
MSDAPILTASVIIILNSLIIGASSVKFFSIVLKSKV